MKSNGYTLEDTYIAVTFGSSDAKHITQNSPINNDWTLHTG